jgi:hypothetical protein
VRRDKRERAAFAALGGIIRDPETEEEDDDDQDEREYRLEIQGDIGTDTE